MLALDIHWLILSCRQTTFKLRWQRTNQQPKSIDDQTKAVLFLRMEMCVCVCCALYTVQWAPLNASSRTNGKMAFEKITWLILMERHKTALRNLTDYWPIKEKCVLSFAALISCSVGPTTGVDNARVWINLNGYCVWNAWDGTRVSARVGQNSTLREDGSEREEWTRAKEATNANAVGHSIEREQNHKTKINLGLIGFLGWLTYCVVVVVVVVVVLTWIACWMSKVATQCANENQTNSEQFTSSS